MKRATQAFTLVEFVIGIVFVGVVLGPLLVFVARLHDLNNALGQQARRDAWRSFSEQAVAVGINPAAPVLQAAVNPAAAAVPPVLVEEQTTAVTPGLPHIVPLVVSADGAIVEPRLPSGGFQIGAGAALPPRTPPQSPLLPIVMPIPVVVPSDGTVIAATSLTAGTSNQPYTTTVRITSAAGTQVHAVFNQPSASIEGASNAEYSVNAVDLVNRVNGIAWTEYPGSVSTGNRAVSLGDGRTRWLVTTAEQRLQIYEPSPIVPFAYQLGLGAPVLVRGGVETPAGCTMNFDYEGYLAVQRGTIPLRIDFPAATKAAFGNSWPAPAIGFQWTFHDVAGAFTGDLAPFFAAEKLSLWAAAVRVAAVPVVPNGATADSAVWQFVRLATPLGEPLLSSVADAAGFFSAGQVQFTAPPRSDGTVVGRLSFDNGARLSTGPTLAIPVVP